MLGEHTMMDGMPVFAYADYIVQGLHDNTIDLTSGNIIINAIFFLKYFLK